MKGVTGVVTGGSGWPGSAGGLWLGPDSGGGVPMGPGGPSAEAATAARLGAAHAWVLRAVSVLGEQGVVSEQLGRNLGLHQGKERPVLTFQSCVQPKAKDSTKDGVTCRDSLGHSNRPLSYLLFLLLFLLSFPLGILFFLLLLLLESYHCFYV